MDWRKECREEAAGRSAKSKCPPLQCRLPRLLDEASWATQGCAPLLRSAITFSACRALAAGIRRSTCSGAEAAYVERCDDQPAPDPACSFDCPVDCFVWLLRWRLVCA